MGDNNCKNILSEEEKELSRKLISDKADSVISDAIINGDSFTPAPEGKEFEFAKKSEKAVVPKIEPATVSPDRSIEDLSIENVGSDNINVSKNIANSGTKDTRGSYNLPANIVALFEDNPILKNTNILADIDDLVNQPQRIIDPCYSDIDPISDIPAYVEGLCKDNLFTDEDKKNKLDEVLPKMAALLGGGDPNNIPDFLTPDRVDEIIGAIKLEGIIPVEEAEMCNDKIKIATGEIKSWNEFVSSEFNTIINKTVDFIIKYSLFQYYFATSLMYHKRFDPDNISTEVIPILNEYESTITSLLPPKGNFNSTISQAYYDFIINQISYWREQIANIDFGKIFMNEKNERSTVARGNDAFTAMVRTLNDIIIPESIDGNLRGISYNAEELENGRGVITSHLRIINREPTEDEAKNNTYITNVVSQTTNNLNTNLLSTMGGVTREQSIKAAQYTHNIVKFYSQQISLRDILTTFKEDAIKSTEDIINTYEIWDLKSQEEKAVEILGSIQCGGKSILEQENGTIGIPAKAKCDTPINLRYSSFPSDPDIDIKSLKYWQCYSDSLNLVALLPQHWTVGLILPSGTRIKLPIVWIPLVVIPTAVSITVIFLTINGVVISPTVYNILWKPVANNKSVHTVLLRGGNKTIKEDTGTKYINTTIINGLDLNPEMTKKAVHIQDDLPIPERMSLKNISYSKYLNEWCKIAKPFMGL